VDRQHHSHFRLPSHVAEVQGVRHALSGANNKELTVQPSFRHVTNLPILLEITVTGIPETVDTRVPVAALTTPAP
jgi:hypothetical protein